MKKTFSFLLLTVIVQLCYPRISTKLTVTPTSPVNTDTVYIQAVTFYGDFISLNYDSVSIRNDTVFIYACHFLASSSIEPPSADTFQVAVGPLHSGTWVAKYVAHGTDSLNDSSCQFYSQMDSTTASFIVGVAGINEIQNNVLSLQLFNGANSNLIVLTPKSSVLISNCNIFLYNSLGQKIRDEYAGAISEQVEVQCSTTDLAPGFYFYEFQLGDERRALKFVKQ